MGHFNELDIEMQNLAQSFRDLADAYHMNVFQDLLCKEPRDFSRVRNCTKL